VDARHEPEAGLDFSQSRVSDLLEALATPQHPAAGGPAAAICAAMASALVAKVARASRGEWIEAGGVVAGALVLRSQAVSLAASDAAAYRRALSVIRRTESMDSSHGGQTGPGAAPIPMDDREAARAVAIGDACEVPLAIAEVGAEIAELASLAALEGSHALRPDAAVAVGLAVAATRGAAHLVEINRMVRAEDPRLVRARAAVAACEEAQARVSERLAGA
jgi:formiminotetrahydrofolate cyclodeaminase